MSESENGDGAIFEQFKELYSQSQSTESTGDTSLDVLLRIVEPPLSQLIQDLAVPHWFNEEVIVAIGEADPAARVSETLEDIAMFPFVRVHPRGYAYHDVTREALRTYLAQKDPVRLRELSCKLAEIFAHQSEQDNAEDSNWERIYHILACNEAEGLEEFDALFMEARRSRRFAVAETLIHMAQEQRVLLSAPRRAWIDFYRGLLAFDLHHWEEAGAIFQSFDIANLPTPLAGRVQLYRGLALEKKGMPQQAEQVYQDCFKHIVNQGKDPGLSARLYQRLAETSLAQRNLKKAESYAKKSRAINSKSRDPRGEAMNLRTLGEIYGKLGDLPRAKKAFETSLEILDEADREFDKAKIYSDLASLYSAFGRVDEAEQHYGLARQVKVSAGDNYGLAYIYSNLGKLYLKSGKTENALNYFSTSLSGFQQFKDHLNSATVLRNISLTYEHHLKDPASALDYMQKAVGEMPEESRLRKEYEKEILRLENKIKGSLQVLIENHPRISFILLVPLNIVCILGGLFSTLLSIGLYSPALNVDTITIALKTVAATILIVVASLCFFLNYKSIKAWRAAKANR